MRLVSLFLVMVPVVAGCAMSDRLSTDPAYMASAAYRARPELGVSLFPSDRAVLSGESIEKILTSKLVAPATVRVALLQFGRERYAGWWSSEVARLNQGALDGCIERLRTCPRVADASLLPALLAPGKQTIPYLREAAARYQADFLLIYRATDETFTKKRVLGRDEVKAYCHVESVLLDTRTGIVPFTAVATREFTAARTGTDLSFAETIRKAERQAFGDAMKQIAADLATFLESVPGATSE